jgi:hypothetical protein
VQAYNDFIIFSVAGAGSLISGVLYAAYGKRLSLFHFSWIHGSVASMTIVTLLLHCVP